MKVKLWDVSGDTPTEKCTLTGHSGWVTSVAFSPDGKTLASGSWDKTVKLWNVENMSCEVTKKSSLDEPVRCVTFSPDNQFLAFTCFRSIMISVWNVSMEHEAVYWPDVREMFSGATSVAFSSDFTLASGFNHGQVRVWYAKSVQDVD